MFYHQNLVSHSTQHVQMVKLKCVKNDFTIVYFIYLFYLFIMFIYRWYTKVAEATKLQQKKYTKVAETYRFQQKIYLITLTIN